MLVCTPDGTDGGLPIFRLEAVDEDVHLIYLAELPTAQREAEMRLSYYAYLTLLLRKAKVRVPITVTEEQGEELRETIRVFGPLTSHEMYRDDYQRADRSIDDLLATFKASSAGSQQRFVRQVCQHLGRGILRSTEARVPGEKAPPARDISRAAWRSR